MIPPLTDRKGSCNENQYDNPLAPDIHSPTPAERSNDLVQYQGFYHSRLLHFVLTTFWVVDHFKALCCIINLSEFDYVVTKF